MAKEKTPKAAPLETAPPAVLTMNGGDFALASVLHLGRIYRTPKMGLLLARVFAIPVLFEICAIRGALQVAKTFALLLA